MLIMHARGITVASACTCSCNSKYKSFHPCVHVHAYADAQMRRLLAHVQTQLPAVQLHCATCAVTCAAYLQLQAYRANIEAHASTCKQMQTHADTCRHMQIHADTCRLMQAHVGTCRHMRRLCAGGVIADTCRGVRTRCVLICIRNPFGTCFHSTVVLVVLFRAHSCAAAKHLHCAKVALCAVYVLSDCHEDMNMHALQQSRNIN